ncbi:MAG: pectate lyase [Clostridia bacterium]|nr:pectate lyase [Clostridia bacterium]
MKKSIWISILVVLCITMVVLAGCVQPKPHECQNKCEQCGKCTNQACAEAVCVDKCQGHAPAHTCESICPTCNKCLDATCTESACAEKCPGHTTPHSCQNKCEICGKCTNENCTEAVCANKCEGHVPPHACQNVCPVCGKCTNEDCAEAVCADKCDGHQETGKIQLQLTGASFESIYAEWLPMGNATYNVYCDGKLVDKELTRNYGSYYRVDIVGITAGEHTVKIVPVFDGTEQQTPATTFTKNVTAHVREGFAFVGGQATGAYNMDGTLKADARVLYVTTNNFDTITMDIQVGKSTVTTQVGLQNILLALKKGYETKPICVRFIGNIVNPTILQKGDLEVDCSTTKFTGGITLEGIGNDATFNGFGVRLKNCSNVEVRNIGFMNCASEEGDSVSLQQDNHHIWIHNCDFFYGMAGSDADQDKGDGAMDCKKSTNVTFSYNHFWDTGKSNLLGVSGEETTNSITYHHNWYDHSDSRHPRVRTATVHVYNNYFDGNSKYGIGATEGCSIFVENNYFNNCKNPMLISKQGTDAQGDGTFSGEDGGIIKAFGNVIVGGKTPIPYSQNATSFDYFDATSRDQVVPSTVVAKSGGTGYNNFDTANTMYDYNVQSAEDARDNVIAWAGRVQGGDFKWTFTDQDNSSYAVDAELKKAIVNYTGKVILADTPVTPNPNPDGGNTDGDNTGDGDNTDGDNQGGITLPQVSHSFENGIESDYFTINGNTSDKKGTVIYNGVTYTQCLKIESSTSITFTTTETMQLTLVLGGSSNNNIKIDGEKVTGTTNVIVVTLEAGTHTITKADTTNLFYIALDVVE